ncbi:MAG: hypothetical protein HY290_20260 [Planctomycetia bacterium]|nr:hypothetical protein [Planctomycetia bacterium]
MPLPNPSRSDDDLPPVQNVNEPETPPARPDRELLEQIVRRTLAEQEGGELPAGLADALREMARRQRAQSRAWEAAAVELVDRVLETWFAGKLLTGEARQRMSAEIADALLNDPAASARLRRFWEQISVEAS